MTIVNTWIDKENDMFVLKVTIGNDPEIYKFPTHTIEEAIAIQDSIIKNSKVIRFYDVIKK